MLGKRNIIIVLTIVITLLTSFIIYQQISKAKESKKTDENLAIIENHVQNLFESENKDNIQEDVNNETLLEINLLIANEEDNNFTEDQESRIEQITLDFKQAELMFEIITNVETLFSKEGFVKEDADPKSIIDKLESSEIISELFKENQLKILSKAQKEIKLINKGKNLIQSMFNADNLVLDNLVCQIKRDNILLSNS